MPSLLCERERLLDNRTPPPERILHRLDVLGIVFVGEEFETAIGDRQRIPEVVSDHVRELLQPFVLSLQLAFVRLWLVDSPERYQRAEVGPIGRNVSSPCLYGESTGVREFYRVEGRYLHALFGGVAVEYRPHCAFEPLEAPGVNAIILTGGHRPPAAVLGTAERRGVPVVSAAGDTLSVVDRAEAIVEDGRTREEGVIDRMRTLLHDHADIDTRLEADGNAGAAADEE